MRSLLIGIITVALMAGSAIGVWGQAEPLFGPMTPSRVSGAWVYEGVVSDGRVEQLGELMFETVGAVTTYRVTSSDSRLGGTATATRDWIGWYPPAGVAVVDTSWLIEDSDGAWAGSTRRAASMADEDPINVDEQVILLEGSGAYESLTAYVIVDRFDETFIGAIIPAEMPELPEDWIDDYQHEDAEDAASVGDPMTEPIQPFPTRDIVVAAREIEAGATIELTDLTLRTVPLDVSNDDALDQPDEAAGKVAAITILRFQPITPNLVRDE